MQVNPAVDAKPAAEDMADVNASEHMSDASDAAAATTVLQLQGVTFTFQTLASEPVVIPDACLGKSALLQDLISGSLEESAEVLVPVAPAALQMWVRHIQAQALPVRRAQDGRADSAKHAPAADEDHAPLSAAGAVGSPLRRPEAARSGSANRVEMAPVYHMGSLGVEDTCVLLTVISCRIGVLDIPLALFESVAVGPFQYCIAEGPPFSCDCICLMPALASSIWTGI